MPYGGLRPCTPAGPVGPGDQPAVQNTLPFPGWMGMQLTPPEELWVPSSPNTAAPAGVVKFLHHTGH